jgi:hypothetical protein
LVKNILNLGSNGTIQNQLTIVIKNQCSFTNPLILSDNIILQIQQTFTSSSTLNVVSSQAQIQINGGGGTNLNCPTIINYGGLTCGNHNN